MAAESITYMAPLFAAALVGEGLCLRGTSRAYSFRRTMSALASSAYDQLLNAATLVLFVGAYASVSTRFAQPLWSHADSFAGTVLVIGVAVMLHDLFYYTYHRLSHRVNVLWAVHVVHHQSHYYDLTVSLRQGTIATVVTYLFYLPMAFFVPLPTFIGVHVAYQVYQFFVHTELVRRLGPAEWLLATPSHHRVHHGTNARYIDRNFGGFFIVFDRLFGTFTEEKEPPRYGVPGGYDEASPAFANLYLFGRLARLSRNARGLGALARLWLGAPESTPELTSSASAPASTGHPWAPAALFVGIVACVVAMESQLTFGVRAALAMLAIAAVEAGCRGLRAKNARI